MFCGLMLGLKVQQRRLLTGHKPISFSRDPSGELVGWSVNHNRAVVPRRSPRA